MHDPRIGRFFAVDPLAPKYPHYSPYGFSGNHVINSVELEGLEDVEVYNKTPEMEKAEPANRRYTIDGLNYNVNRTDNWDSEGNRTSVDIRDRAGDLIISYSDESHINAAQINNILSERNLEKRTSTESSENESTLNFTNPYGQYPTTLSTLQWISDHFYAELNGGLVEGTGGFKVSNGFAIVAEKEKKTLLGFNLNTEDGFKGINLDNSDETILGLAVGAPQLIGSGGSIQLVKANDTQVTSAVMNVNFLFIGNVSRTYNFAKGEWEETFVGIDLSIGAGFIWGLEAEGKVGFKF